MVGSDGGVFALGGANFYGSLGGQSLPSPIAAIAATPSEDGYWLASQAGTIYHFGNTPSLPAVQLPPGAHIVGMASDNTGKGAWLVDQLGDVYAEGDANYLGGMGGKHINAPVVGHLGPGERGGLRPRRFRRRGLRLRRRLLRLGPGLAQGRASPSSPRSSASR